MELFSRRNLTITALALTLATAACASKGGHVEAASHASPGVSAAGNSGGTVDPNKAPANPNLPSASPNETNDGTGGTGDQNQANGGTEGKKGGPKNPRIFVVADHSGKTALFGCMRVGDKVYTFGNDFVEGQIKGGTVTESGITKAAGDQTPGQLQHKAAANPEELLTGPQTIGGAQVDCGHDIDLGNTPLFDEAGPTTPDSLQVDQPVADNGQGGLVLLGTGHA